ncbi:chemotaxis response regulator protein-glutamate methylesterase [Paenibacillus validus]|uniref:Protein-glutamate methylesterase/protein-glutamine glutaminase n=1 Tax=Paenibacillus validus TaxID=44253 RepID=A0A7X3CSZ5_9BACL|nr:MULTISPECIES: chemotaxis response regulator protein-glutamate methylesterase [Paenibacillus]MED4602701.1 chemotaxis response regulator protein-glutamate methylesterase [Paenibacillus validus]MED4607130.1 chemotaxis response regulator protein-glutamate methylesterase [Paenibacillus validus]MUG70509.1 chemotaxis-specific protein-glutamate methyltransferase CheB [Paenibacillus validus]
MQQPFDVLVVDDSIFMRKIISDFISQDPMLRVVGTARNGKEAVEQVKKLQPHAVTMDIEMPEMNGLEALRVIMKESPVAVIMLSSLTQEGASETIKALEWGAVDFVGKPSGSISLDLHKVKTQLLEKLHIAVRMNVNKIGLQRPILPRQPELKPIPQARTTAAAAPSNPSPKAERRSVDRSQAGIGHLVAIGTSTGGPRALHQVLSELPAELAAPVVIVQHMPPNFTRSLAQRLNSISGLKVVEAEEGMPLENGTAYIAPGGSHMAVARNGPGAYRIHLSKEEPRSGHRPSVDVLFESLLPLKELKRHIVIMTGMGSDGAKGMLALKESGAVTTIAESEETCIVYGMPRAAVELKGVMHVLKQQEIAGKLISAIGLSALS